MKEGDESDLAERVVGDPAFGIDRTAFADLLHPDRFVGRAPEQVDRFLAEGVEPAIARLGAEADRIVGAPDIRV
jgi:adenylosuccinate lyase